jgi:hypothetical protein
MSALDAPEIIEKPWEFAKPANGQPKSFCDPKSEGRG